MRITHRSASRAWGLRLASLAVLAVAATPLAAGAQTVEAGHLAVVGTFTYPTPDQAGCAATTFTEQATATGVIDDPVGSYVGPLTVSASGVSLICGGPVTSATVDTGSFDLSVSGSNGTDTVVCRDYLSSAADPQPMPGLYFRFGDLLILGSDGICSIDGNDTVHEQVYQTLVFAPTGVSVDSLRYTGGAVAGDLRIGE